MTLLQHIIKNKKDELKSLDLNLFPDLSHLKPNVKLDDILKEEFLLICEYKRKSPSKGLLTNKTILEKMSDYSNKGIKVVSILTDNKYFGGSYQDIIDVRQTFPEFLLLNKEFILEEIQIDIAHKLGVSAILLIAHILTEKKLNSLYNYAKKLDLEVLVETHFESDIFKINRIGAPLVGINHRNLDSLEIDKKRLSKLIPLLNYETKLIAESAIDSSKELETLKHHVNGALVGSALLKENFYVI
jgi:indole-3-glycerol phosphate synthase